MVIKRLITCSLSAISEACASRLCLNVFVCTHWYCLFGNFIGASSFRYSLYSLIVMEDDEKEMIVMEDDE